MTEHSVAYAIDLIKSGKKEEGKNLLIELIIKDPYDEEAWLWMSSASSGDERITCLQKALEINPENKHARAMLKKITSAPSDSENAGDLDSPDRNGSKTSGSSRKANQLEDDLAFSPDIRIIFFVHILPWFFLFALMTIWAVVLKGWLDEQYLLLMISLCAVACVIMMIRKMTVLKVRITKSGVKGPFFFTLAWLKHEIPFAAIDLRKTATSLGFIGYYRLRSYEGKSVYLIGYHEETLLKIASLIKHYQSQ